MNRTLALCLATITCGTAFAADTYTIDPRHTFPVFEVSHLGFSTQRGRFNKVGGKVTLDTAAGTGQIQAAIAVDSIDMGLEDWDKHMKNADFFNVEQFPVMTFAADKLRFEGGKPVSAEGTLTLLGVTKPVTLAINRFHCGIHPMLRKEMCGADVTATIKRSEFGMTKYVPAVGDEIRINIAIEAFKD